ncbi:hypothetical protein GCM10018779_40030 [Streptomyces griseocarneus]|nr:hypothetical protein GCM10018779_40030 [Streptomyces griseocarneus]
MPVDADDADVEAAPELRELGRPDGVLGMDGHGPYPFRESPCVVTTIRVNRVDGRGGSVCGGYPRVTGAHPV